MAGKLPGTRDTTVNKPEKVSSLKVLMHDGVFGNTLYLYVSGKASYTEKYKTIQAWENEME